ncbi:MAG: hypothetical protein ABI672_08075 [Vicinamibacteria bacterium]
MKLLVGALVFALVFAVAFTQRGIPLGFAGGSVDGDWFDLGANLATYGVLGFGNEPLVYRPPGFPAFVALVLKVVVDPASNSDDILNTRGPSGVLTAQAIVLAIGAVELFLLMALRLRLFTAFAAALLFGTNPYSLAVASLVHYDVLAWAAILMLLLALDRAFQIPDARVALAAFFGAGCVLAAGALIRPVAMLAPFFLVAVFWARKNGSARWKAYATFLAGFAVVLLPWTARNFVVTGRVLPVHAQGWTATFVSSATAMVRNPDVYEWNAVARRYYLPLYKRVTGEETIETGTYARNVIALEDAARAATFVNLRAKPHIYLLNVFTGAKALCTQINAGILTIYTKAQTRTPFRPEWIAAGSRDNILRGPEGDSFRFLHDLLGLTGVFGVCLALKRRDPFLAVPVAIALTIVATHALSYLDYYYYAVKMPFLVLFGFYGVDMLPRAPRLALIVSLLGLSATLSWLMGFFS